MLKTKVEAGDADAGGFVHWGATSQDVVDTAMVLLLRRCRDILDRDRKRVLAALRRLSDEHAETVMLARTLLQPAPPVTFGLKSAGWYAGVHRGWQRVSSRFDEALCLQFGGASGTLAALGDQGLEVSETLASELGLKLPDAPWHGYRDRLAALMAALSIFTATLGKVALDIALLMQFEVGEAAEPGGDGRGGSSSMPHKRNPTACVLTLAAAKRVPGLLADFVSIMVQEHERAAGLASRVASGAWNRAVGGVALESMVEVLEGLIVDRDRMRSISRHQRRRLCGKRRLSFIARIGQHAAREKVDEMLRNRWSADLAGVNKPEEYLGSAEAFRRRLLKEVHRMPFARSKDCRIYYRLEGSPDKPLLVLAHALGTDHGLWDLQMPAFLRYFQVLRPDLRGHGASDAPVGDYTMAQLGEDILAAVTRESFSYCGISLGGMIGQWLASRDPGQIERLVIANSSPRVADPNLFEIRRQTVLREGMAAFLPPMERFFKTISRQNRSEPRLPAMPIPGDTPRAVLRYVTPIFERRSTKYQCPPWSLAVKEILRSPGRDTAQFSSVRFRGRKR
jgi:3-carboxy-cis,cis-muconate cycloisomerase